MTPRLPEGDCYVAIRPLVVASRVLSFVCFVFVLVYNKEHLYS